MTYVKVSSMLTQTRGKTFSAKTPATLFTLKDIRRWLIDNCKQRWTATDYKGDSFNWRKLSKVGYYSTNEMFDITIIVHFSRSEDLMLYLLSWPSEVLINN